MTILPLFFHYPRLKTETRFFFIQKKDNLIHSFRHGHMWLNLFSHSHSKHEGGLIEYTVERINQILEQNKQFQDLFKLENEQILLCNHIFLEIQ